MVAGDRGISRRMTDPNDDLSSIADPGSMGPDEMTEPQHETPGDGPGVPGAAADSPAAQGAPVGPPD